MRSVTRIFIVSSLVLFASSQAVQSECPPIYVFTGEADRDFLGISVASAGDVNNDGYDDLIIGAFNNDDGGEVAGRVYVYSGLNGDTLYVLTGTTGDRFGISVSSAGDVNSDGFADFFVGATGYGAGNTGRAYVFSGLNGDTLYIFTGETADDFLGRSVALAGDINGDGIADLIVGASGNGDIGSVAGRAFVFSGLNGDTLHVFTGEALEDLFGGSVASAGDVNNDGFADLIVGAPLNDANSAKAGRAYVFSGLNGDTLHIFTGEARVDHLGWSVAGAGDVDNDGHADLIVGAFLNNSGGQQAGRAYVFSGLNGDTLHIFTGEATTDQFGISVASAGDVNNDGHADLIVTAWNNDAGGVDNAGRAYIYSGVNGHILNIFSGSSLSEHLGSSVASIGDISGDGFPDLIIGADLSSAGGPNAGRAYVYPSARLLCGDANGDGLVTNDDLTFLIDFYFFFEEFPCGFGGDVNEDGSTDIADIVYMSGFLNNNGPAPCAASEPPPSSDPKKEPEGRQTGSNGY